MKNNNIKELKKDLRKLSFKPSESFEVKTLAIIEDVANEGPHPNTLDFKEDIFMKYFSKYKFALISTLILLFLVVPLGYSFLVNRVPVDEQNVIVQILKNNFVKQIMSTKTSAEEIGSKELLERLGINIIDYSKEGLFWQTRYQITPGNRFSECFHPFPFGQFPKDYGPYIYENSFYNNGYKNFLSKINHKDADGNIIFAYINETNGNVIQNIEYRGGKYAYKQTIKERNLEVLPASYPDSEGSDEGIKIPSTPDELMESYFGKGYQIDWNFKYKNESYIGIKNSYQQSCMGSPLTKESKEFVLYTVNLIDKDSYKTVTYLTYYDSISEENLAEEQILISEREEIVDRTQVQTNFELPNEIPVKEVENDYSNIVKVTGEEESNRVFNGFLNENIKVFYPSNWNNLQLGTGASLYNIENKNFFDIGQFIYDRNFYPDGSLGDNLYKQAKPEAEWPIEIYADYDLKNNDDSLHFWVYNTLDLESVLKRTKVDFGEILEESIKDIEITIDGKPVKATLATYKAYYAYVNKKDQQASDTCNIFDGCWSYFYNLIFQDGTKSYVLKGGGMDIGTKDISQIRELKSYDLNIPENSNYLKTSLKNKIDDFNESR